MNYTPLIDEAGTIKWDNFHEPGIAFTIMAAVAAMIIVYTLRDCVPFVKKHTLMVGILTLIPFAGAAFGVVAFANSAEDKLEAAKVQNLQIMKDNLATKYDMDVDPIVLSDYDRMSRPVGAGMYELVKQEEGTRSAFRVTFEDSGEPFIHVDEVFTKGEVNEMMR